MVRNYDRYVYLEDESDVVTIHGFPYEEGVSEDVAGQSISIVGSFPVGFQQMHIIKLLQKIISFKFTMHLMERDIQKNVLIGLYDMNLLLYSNLLSRESLFPAIETTNRLWVVNMDMIGNSTYFLKLFDFYLWLAFLATFTIIGFLSTLGIYILQRYEKTRMDHLTWYSTLTNQGGLEESRLVFPKILLLSLSILAIVFYGSFEAFLSSYLAFRQPDLPFTNLDELLATPDYTICAPYGTPQYKYILNHSSNSISHRINNDHCPAQYKAYGINTASLKYDGYCPRDKTVFFVPLLLEINDICSAFNIIPLREKYLRQPSTVMVSPGFKFREPFNRGLLRVRTAGFVNHLVTRLKIESDADFTLSRLNLDSSISIHQTQIVLLIPVVGILLGAIIFVFERWLKC